MSIKGRDPDRIDVEWAEQFLTPAEITLFGSMTPTDQSHSLEVARIVETSLAAGDSKVVDQHEWVFAAALLHDIGKVEAGAGVGLRVVAALAGWTISESAALRMSNSRGPVGRLGRQLRYPLLGASLLGAIGSHQFVRAWAAEHHSPTTDWTIPTEAGLILRNADDSAS